MEEQRTFNPTVEGSSPSSSTPQFMQEMHTSPVDENLWVVPFLHTAIVTHKQWFEDWNERKEKAVRLELRNRIYWALKEGIRPDNLDGIVSDLLGAIREQLPEPLEKPCEKSGELPLLSFSPPVEDTPT